jgi:hypothetical protein
MHHKNIWGSDGIVPYTFLKIGIIYQMGVSCQLHAPVYLLSKERKKKNSIPSRQETRSAQNQSGYCREEKNYCFCWECNSSSSVVQPIVQHFMKICHFVVKSHYMVTDESK